jgi:hypothetical protein
VRSTMVVTVCRSCTRRIPGWENQASSVMNEVADEHDALGCAGTFIKRHQCHLPFPFPSGSNSCPISTPMRPCRNCGHDAFLVTRPADQYEVGLPPNSTGSAAAMTPVMKSPTLISLQVINTRVQASASTYSSCIFPPLFFRAHRDLDKFFRPDAERSR